jgi:vacuolar protein sorting-associated protein VTA1
MASAPRTTPPPMDQSPPSRSFPAPSLPPTTYYPGEAASPVNPPPRNISPPLQRPSPTLPPTTAPYPNTNLPSPTQYPPPSPHLPHQSPPHYQLQAPSPPAPQPYYSPLPPPPSLSNIHSHVATSQYSAGGPPARPLSTPYFPPQQPDEEAVAAAQKHCRWAISALNYDDVPTAIKELRNALGRLGVHSL